MRDTFLRSGEVGRDLLEVDWASTPLGPLETWPSSLETVVRMVLTSRFSMWMAWGPDLTFFCNDAYRRDTLGKKYPWALGKPASTVWSEVWHDVAPLVDQVLQTGVATWDESLLLFLERNGYPEETYHTFSYSPLTDDSGHIAGMLCVVIEDTQSVIGNRHLRVLRDLGVRSAANLGEVEAVERASRQLGTAPEDLPFTLTYLFDEAAGTATLAGQTGFKGDHPAAPPVLSLESDFPWPATAVRGGETVVVADLGDRFADLPTGPWPDPPTTAVVLPLAQSGQPRPSGMLVAGVNRYRPLDESYRDFLDLVAAQLTALIGDARSYDFERRRAESLAALDQAKTDFFTNISHEFRTPLTLLLGPAEDALADSEDPLPPRQRQRLDLISRNGQRLLKLVNTLLDFSRLESGRIHAQFEPTDLAELTRELAAMFDAAAERLGLTLTVDCPPLSAPVYVDRDLWAKVVLNLLSNALKFTFTGGITVRLREHDGAAELSVADTGTGIPSEELPHLFERFRRVPGATSRTHEGSGIGLALVAELSELHGGRATATSTPGEGSVFSVRVPFGTHHLPADSVVTSGGPAAAAIAQSAGPFVGEAVHWAAEEAPTAAESGPARRHDSGAARVLVVDDNSDVRLYVAGLLGDEYVVEAAVDGMDALEKARERVPDLVLTDVMMPRMDGFQLLAALREDPLTVGVPVVMLSARAGEEGLLEGLDAGADDYLVKPFTARELQARVRANLELDRARRTRRQLERSRSLLDQAQRLAHVGSWEVDLGTGALDLSDETVRIVGRTRDEIAAVTFPAVLDELVHPDDLDLVRRAIEAALDGAEIALEVRLLHRAGDAVLVSVRGEMVPGEDGRPGLLRGSLQDITERRAAEEALSLAAVNAEAAAREHAIADELQRSLMPRLSFDLDHLDVATYYRAGVEGTQVGGDWFDVIELGAGRTALVVGDVMGRGVQAAAVMGQLSAAVRAYARLDLPPADVLEFLDGIVRELGENQIVTCVYAVFDPADRTLRFANAGHLPPILVRPGAGAETLVGAEDPPLGAGPFNLTQQEVSLPARTLAVLYTDGLVERRGKDLEVGIETLARLAADMTGHVTEMPEQLVQALLPDGPDDDVAILVARVDTPPSNETLVQRFEASERAVLEGGHLGARHRAARDVSETLVDDAVLATSELLTNAVVHGIGPIHLRVRTLDREVLIEV
ncbi:MAG: SpoIIE family protein phosphatase, partial [Nocardioidaceae bacterium]